MATSRIFGRIIPLPRAGQQPGVNGAWLREIRRPSRGDGSSASLDKPLLAMRVDQLRDAIRRNQVSFPSQIPVFSRHTRPDLQRKLVQLYFVSGWSAPQIRARYELGAQRFQQVLSTWKNRAIQLGYIQVIPPDDRVLSPSLKSPLRINLSEVQHSAPEPARSTAKQSRALQKQRQPVEADNKHESSCRPRKKCDSRRIDALLKQLQNGHSLEDLADEAGVTTSTIRVWKRQQQMRLLQRENRQLKELLTKLGAMQKTNRPN